MTSDLPFEAAFLRGALLVGLMHEQDAHDWAESLIHEAPDMEGVLADLLMTPVELSAMREALWVLSKQVDARKVGAAILTAAALEGDTRAPDDRLRVLADIRANLPLPKEVAAAIKSFENRRMFAAVGVPAVTSPGSDELMAFLDRVRAPGFFNVLVDGRIVVLDEAQWKAARARGPLPVRSRIPYPQQ